MNAKSIIAVASLGLLACTGMAATSGQQIPLAPHGRNVSQHANFGVYADAIASGVEVVSVTDQKGALMFSVITSSGQAQVPHVGTHWQLVQVAETAMDGGPVAKSDVVLPPPGARCPCNSIVLYENATSIIVGITDASGNLISIHVLTKTKPN